jgi:hypothetical protein
MLQTKAPLLYQQPSKHHTAGSKSAMKKTQEEEDECDSLLQKIEKIHLDPSLVPASYFSHF